MIRKGILLVFQLIILFCFDLRGQVQIFNIADDFINYYKSSKDLPDELKIENFTKKVYNNTPLIYEKVFNDIRWIGQEPEERILMSVNNFETIEKKYTDLSRTLYTQFDSAILLFQKEFPDFKPDFDVYIMHSLGIRAGGLVTIQDKKVLMFGVAQIAKYFDLENYMPFFHHELTHMYHSMCYTPLENGEFSEGSIYNNLWTEGLAVYISTRLNPAASEKEVFMRDSLSQKTNKVLKIIAREISGNLYSTDKELIRKYFWESSADPSIPKTAGYYLGYILVKEMAKTYSLEELFKLKEDAFIPEFEMILNDIYI